MYLKSLHCALFLSFVFALSGCLDTPKTGAKNIEFMQNGLVANEFITTRESLDGNSRLIHTGIFEDGTAYEVAADGMYAIISSLPQKGRYGLKSKYIEIYCNQNAMNDALMCDTYTNFNYASGMAASLQDSWGFKLTSRGFSFPYLLCINEHDYPGETARIRFDKNKPVSLGEDGCTSSAPAIQKLFKSNIVAIDYAHWPNGRTSQTVQVSHTENYTRILNYMAKLNAASLKK